MKSSVFIRTEVLAVGGKRHHFAEMLHLNTMTWHQISPLVQARGFHQFAIVYHHPGRNYYTFGGIDIMFPSASKLERWPSYEHIFRYNKQTDVWDIPGRMLGPMGRHHGISAIFKSGKFYIFGGHSGDQVYQSYYVLL